MASLPEAVSPSWTLAVISATMFCAIVPLVAASRTRLTESGDTGSFCEYAGDENLKNATV